MSDIDLIYNRWVKSLVNEYSSVTPNFNNQNHIFELGKILRDLGLSPIQIDEAIENIRNQYTITRINEERERKVPPGHILVKNKKSGYLYIILKSTYNDNPERYALPTSIEKSEWESGEEKTAEKPEDTVIKTPRVSKAKLKADPSTADITLNGDVEDEEPLNAIQSPMDTSTSITKFKINKSHFSKNRLPSEEEFSSKRKKAGLELPETLEPYRVPDEIKQTALVPVTYVELVERIINTHNIEQGEELSFYIEELDVSGNLPDQLGQLITAINLTVADELSEYFVEDLKNYISYMKQYDESNQTTYSNDSALTQEWIKIASKNRKKMLNFLSNKFKDEFIVVAATSSDVKDLNALNVGSKSSEKIGDVNVKVNANDKDYWLRIKLEIPEKTDDSDTDEKEIEPEEFET
jgi:hypothetical protein